MSATAASIICRRAQTEIKLTQDDTHVGWCAQRADQRAQAHASAPQRAAKAIGGGPQFVDPQVGSPCRAIGRRLSLCTDGLTEGIYNGHLAELLRAEDSHLAKTLVEVAVKNDGRDNTTALVVRVS